MTRLLLQSLLGGLAVAAAAFAASYFFRCVRPQARDEGCVMVVEYGRPLRVFVIVGWVFVAALSVAAAIVWSSDPRCEGVMAIGSAGFFFLLVLICHLEFFHVAMRYDVEGLSLSSPWRRDRQIPWSAVTEVRFSQVLQWYEISTTGFGKVRLHLYLSGLQSLLDELVSRGIPIPSISFPHRRRE